MDNATAVTIVLFVAATIFGLIGIIYYSLTKRTDDNSEEIKQVKEKYATKEEVKEVKEDAKKDNDRLENFMIRLEEKIDRLLALEVAKNEK